VDPAEHLRARLADCKRRGRRFDWSWRTGRAAPLAAAPEGRERDEWSAAFGSTRAAWRRA
jgi:hypothetical protein